MKSGGYIPRRLRLGIYSPPLQGIVVLQYTIFEVKFASFSLFGIKNTKVNCKLKGWVVCLSDMFAFDEEENVVLILTVDPSIMRHAAGIPVEC